MRARHGLTCGSARPAPADAADVRKTRGQHVRHDDGVVFALVAGQVCNRQRVDVGSADGEIAHVRLRQREIDDGLARRADDLRGQEHEVAAGRVLRRRRRLPRRQQRRDVERVDVDAIARRNTGRVDGAVVRLDRGIAAGDDDAVVDGGAVEAQHLAEAVHRRRVAGIALPRRRSSCGRRSCSAECESRRDSTSTSCRGRTASRRTR